MFCAEPSPRKEEEEEEEQEPWKRRGETWRHMETAYPRCTNNRDPPSTGDIGFTFLPSPSLPLSNLHVSFCPPRVQPLSLLPGERLRSVSWTRMDERARACGGTWRIRPSRDDPPEVRAGRARMRSERYAAPRRAASRSFRINRQ